MGRCIMDDVRSRLELEKQVAELEKELAMVRQMVDTGAECLGWANEEIGRLKARLCGEEL